MPLASAYQVMDCNACGGMANFLQGLPSQGQPFKWLCIKCYQFCSQGHEIVANPPQISCGADPCLQHPKKMRLAGFITAGLNRPFDFSTAGSLIFSDMEESMLEESSQQPAVEQGVGKAVDQGDGHTCEVGNNELANKVAAEIKMPVSKEVGQQLELPRSWPRKSQLGSYHLPLIVPPAGKLQLSKMSVID